MSCAQCHDHPNVKDWTQGHFYGLKGFFARTYDASGFLAETDHDNWSAAAGRAFFRHELGFDTR